MGRASVRAAAVAWFTGTTIPFLGTVYPSRTVIQEEDYEAFMQSGAQIAANVNGSGAVMVVHLPNDNQSRKALSGRSFLQDVNVHQVVLELMFASTGGDPLAAQADHDSLIDAVVARIRHDPTLGASATVWEAGEDQGVSVSQGEPYTDDEGLTVFITALVRFTAWEWISTAA